MLSLDNETYGLPLDSRHTYTKSDWEVYIAALWSSTSTDVHDLFIKGVYSYVSGGASGNRSAFGDWYETTDTTPIGFRARRVLGGHLALVSSPRHFVVPPD